MEADQMMRAWLGLHWGDGVACKLGDRGPVGQILFLTLTLPHDAGEPCADLMETMRDAWRTVFGGSRWQKDKGRFRASHYIRAHDATHGRNGWHPHFHAVLFVQAPLVSEEIKELADRLYERFAHAVEKRGHRRPSREHGIHLEPARCPDDLSGYLAKVEGVKSGARVALELARGDLKEGSQGGRTPFGILASLEATGDADDLRLMHEWEKATKGVHFMQCSRGLRRLLNVAKRSDEEIVEEEVRGETVYVFGPLEWAAMTRRRGGLAAVLEMAETEGGLGVGRLMRKWMQQTPARAGPDPRVRPGAPQ